MSETTSTKDDRERKFLARYYHRGSWWTLEFFALDFDDAEAICRAHKSTA